MARTSVVPIGHDAWIETRMRENMRVYVVTMEYKHSPGETWIEAFSSPGHASRWLYDRARELADERGEDYQPGEWREYLDELEEAGVIRFETASCAIDSEVQP